MTSAKSGIMGVKGWLVKKNKSIFTTEAQRTQRKTFIFLLLARLRRTKQQKMLPLCPLCLCGEK